MVLVATVVVEVGIPMEQRAGWDDTKDGEENAKTQHSEYLLKVKHSSEQKMLDESQDKQIVVIIQAYQPPRFTLHLLLFYKIATIIPNYSEVLL